MDKSLKRWPQLQIANVYSSVFRKTFLLNKEIPLSTNNFKIPLKVAKIIFKLSHIKKKTL
jgi:hypothetical protein